ncbi:Alcohol dehydrogenase-like [Quillaja saponaria]|uniref:alcohol dehydrogenase n=1 Tax=Quillaja saponaria TaxID=32244 RepID=A0AAD7PBZ0_QUISA|nr:Alcohol dehydrogenase-like [Quillaja saponaria]
MMNGIQTITCKAAVCWGLGEPLKVEEIQVEPPQATEVRVKMLYSSLCHTDVLCIYGFPEPLFPRVLGHEGVGVIESIGEKVTGLEEGDLVIPTFLGECQECENCISGKTNLCLKYPLILNGLMFDQTSRLSINGQKLYQSLSCSTWSEYIVIDSSFIVKIDPSLALSHASFLSCGFSTGYGAAWKEAQIEKGSSVAVLGLGAVGLGAIIGAKDQGATKIIGIDINEKKKGKGEVFGMTDFINSSGSDKSISELVMELTGGKGVDYCLECTGVPSLLTQALEATKLGKGKAIAVGAGNDASVSISFVPLLCGRTLKGTIFGGLKTQTDLPIIIDKCKNKELPLDELLTHEILLEDINKAFELLERPDCVKVLIKI